MFSTESQFSLPSWRLPCQLPTLVFADLYPGTNIWFPPWGNTGSWAGGWRELPLQIPTPYGVEGKELKGFLSLRVRGGAWQGVKQWTCSPEGTCSAREKNTKCPEWITGGKLVHVDASAEDTGAWTTHRWKEVSCTSSKANQKTKQNKSLLFILETESSSRTKEVKEERIVKWLFTFERLNCISWIPWNNIHLEC